MSKFMGLLAAALVAVGFAAPARAEFVVDAQALQQAFTTEAALSGLNWKVGDKASYKISIGGFINGTSENFVREDTGTSLWMVQDMNMGMMGKQKVEILINKTNGQIEKLLVNGKEQQAPAAGDVEIVDMKESHIRVAAGEFDCVYVKVKDKQSGQVQEAWMNPQAVPMSGTLKSLGQSQLGQVTQELTSFQFARQ